MLNANSLSFSDGIVAIGSPLYNYYYIESDKKSNQKLSISNKATVFKNKIILISNFAQFVYQQKQKCISYRVRAVTRGLKQGRQRKSKT